jgi:predicted  nucleic acid-binding Zn-ribbon protein
MVANVTIVDGGTALDRYESVESVETEDDGLRVTKHTARAGSDRAVVDLTIEATGDEVVGVWFVERLPSGVHPGGVDAHDDVDSSRWSLTNDGNLLFEVVVDPAEPTRLGYVVTKFDEGEPDPLFEPPTVDETHPIGGAESGPSEGTATAPSADGEVDGSRTETPTGPQTESGTGPGTGGETESRSEDRDSDSLASKVREALSIQNEQRAERDPETDDDATDAEDLEFEFRSGNGSSTDGAGGFPGDEPEFDLGSEGDTPEPSGPETETETETEPEPEPKTEAPGASPVSGPDDETIETPASTGTGSTSSGSQSGSSSAADSTESDSTRDAAPSEVAEAVNATDQRPLMRGANANATGLGNSALDDEAYVRKEDVPSVFVDQVQSGALDDEEIQALREALGIESRRSTIARLQHVEGRVTEFEAYLEALEVFIDDKGTANEIISNLEDAIETLTSRVDALEADLQELEQRQSTVSETVEKHDTTLTTLETRTGTIEERTESLDSTTTEHESRIDDLADRQDRLEVDLDESIASVEDALDESIETVHADLDESIASVEDDLDESLESVETDLADLADRMAELESSWETVREAFGSR